MAESKIQFFLADFVHTGQSKPVVEKGALHFSLSRPSAAGPEVADHEYVDRAKREHLEQYPREFKEFRKAHPLWEIPLGWEDLDVKVAAPAVEAGVAKKKKGK